MAALPFQRLMDWHVDAELPIVDGSRLETSTMPQPSHNLGEPPSANNHCELAVRTSQRNKSVRAKYMRIGIIA